MDIERRTFRHLERAAPFIPIDFLHYAQKKIEEEQLMVSSALGHQGDMNASFIMVLEDGNTEYHSGATNSAAIALGSAVTLL